MQNLEIERYLFAVLKQNTMNGLDDISRNAVFFNHGLNR